jgi:hypothetical protein
MAAMDRRHPLPAEQPVLVRDLPLLSGASKEAVAFATGFLSRHGYATIAAGPSRSSRKTLVLTARGQSAREVYLDLVPVIESRWRGRFGSGAIDRLQISLQTLVTESPEDLLPLIRGIEPQPGNWRSELPRPGTLPYFPLVLHRGGYPDGS